MKWTWTFKFVLCTCIFKGVNVHVFFVWLFNFWYCFILLAWFIARCHALLHDSFSAGFVCFYSSEVHFVLLKVLLEQIFTALILKCSCSPLQDVAVLLALKCAVFISWAFYCTHVAYDRPAQYWGVKFSWQLNFSACCITVSA